MFKSYIGQGSSAARSWASHNSHVAVLRHDSPEIRRDLEPRSDNDEPCCMILYHTTRYVLLLIRNQKPEKSPGLKTRFGDGRMTEM
jgi:hypothetical protein